MINVDLTCHPSFFLIFREASLRRRNLDKPTGGSNIRRLYDDKPDDEDNATWNGNSTQQM